MDGWIKLHRRLLKNDELFRARSTFPVFCILLLLSDRDGKVTTGRFVLARWLKLNPNTVYSALKRLEAMRIIQQQSNNKSTTVTILNWAKYQSIPSSDKTDFKREAHEVQHQNNTIQEYKNQEENKNNTAEVNSAGLEKTLKEIDASEKVKYEYQLLGLELWEQLGAPTSKKSEFIRLVRDYPRPLLQKAFAFAQDYPRRELRWKMFFKKFSVLLKEKNEKPS